jgi:hypothetical protein
MDRLTINTGLEDFILLGSIVGLEPRTIRAVKVFEDAPAFLAMEALAQLGAMHARWSVDFERHVFLLAIQHCVLPASPKVSGRFQLRAEQTAHSRAGFAYEVLAEDDSGPVAQGAFMFATTAYGEAFDRQILETHYRKVLACLTNGSANA